jgi:hypothetical protein
MPYTPTGWVPDEYWQQYQSTPDMPTWYYKDPSTWTAIERWAHDESQRLAAASGMTLEQYIGAANNPNPMDTATQLYFSDGSQAAQAYAVQNGIDLQALDANVRQVNETSQARRRAGWNPLVSAINATTADFVDNPLAFAGKLGALGTAMSFLPGASGTSAAAGGSGGAATTYPLATGGPVTVTPLAGGGTAAGTGAAAGAGGILDSSGAVIPGTEAVAGGGSMWENILNGIKGNWGSLAGGLLGYLDANNQPDSMTSIYAPDAALTEAGRGLLSDFSSLYNGGYTPAGIDPSTDEAINRLYGFGGDAINPYLDRVFNSAADATQGRLSSEFALSGRKVGSDDHRGYRSEELQTLAADIYGRGYENERNRELASVAPLLAAGEYSRGVTQEQIDAPTMNAMRYMASLNSLLPLFPGMNTQPLFSNPWAGFLGGAQLGKILQGA